MKHLVFLLEEPSARDLLEGLLPRILPENLAVYYLVFEGKQDLEGQLVHKVRGWQLKDSAFVVLRDQDAAECRVVKDRQIAGPEPESVQELSNVLLGHSKAGLGGDLMPPRSEDFAQCH